jgi:hypothetical protein
MTIFSQFIKISNLFNSVVFIVIKTKDLEARVWAANLIIQVLKI